MGADGESKRNANQYGKVQSIHNKLYQNTVTLYVGIGPIPYTIGGAYPSCHWG